MPNLQTFIEQNAGKSFMDMGGSTMYIWGNTTLYTRHNLATDIHSIEVYLGLSWMDWNFSACFDDREIKNNIEFYEWLKTVFFPMAKEKLLKL